MKEPAVVDSTCLIGLEQLGRLDLLPNLFEPLYAPPEVQRESGLSAEWLRIEAPANLKPHLCPQGDGRRWGSRSDRAGHGAELEDRPGRPEGSRSGQRMGLKIIGTVGILVRAKRSGLVPWISPLLNELTEQGFHLSEDLKREALRLVGE